MKFTDSLTSTAGKGFIPDLYGAIKSAADKLGYDWFQEELLAFRPPERLTVSEWADKYRILDAQTSNEPGLWRTSRTPYLREPMDQFCNPEIEIIVFKSGTQQGKTEFLLNCMGYSIAQDPGPTMVIYPTEEAADHIATKRLGKMIDASEVMRNRLIAAESTKKELQFIDMYLSLAWANSPSSVSSKPCRRVIMDEVDKYPTFSGREASPIELGRERTKTFDDKKILIVSTPTTEVGQVEIAFKQCDIYKQYFVPCPHCGVYQKLEFKNIHYPEKYKQNAAMARESAQYVCPHCGCIIEDRQKDQMLRAGEWREVNFYDDDSHHMERPARIKSIGYQLSSLYSPWVTWGQIAEEFVKSYQYPEKLMNFVNSWLAETWKDNVTKRSVEMVKGAQCKTLERGRLPEGALLLTAGVDVQEDRMYWTVRAWGEHLTSWGIDHGEAETWDDITRQLIERQFEDTDGNMCVIQLICVDSGDQTDEVYGYCSDHSEICVPVKGASQRLKAPFTRSRLDRPDRFDGIILYMVDTFYFKSFIHSRLTKKPEENGAWMVYNEIDDEYSEQIVSEQKVLEKNRRNGKIIEVYKPVTQHAANHYLDAEVYSACAAEILEVRYLHKDKEQRAAKPPKPAPVKEEKNTQKWVRASNNWLRR